MSVAFKQMRVYLRVGVVLIVALVVGLVLFQNRNHRVAFWFFGLTDTAEPINVIYLMVCTAAGALASWWALLLARGVWRDWRELSLARKADQASNWLKQREANLDERERRLDEKVQESISKENEIADE